MNTVITPSIDVLSVMDIVAEAARKMADKAGLHITIKQIVKYNETTRQADMDQLKTLSFVGGLIREIASKAAGVDIDVQTP